MVDIGSRKKKPKKKLNGVIARIKFKQEEFERLNGICPFCKVEMTFKKDQSNSITFDHVIPAAKGGSGSISNGLVMCAACNNRKGGYTLTQFVKYRFWELPAGNFKILKKQLFVARTGHPAAMKDMGRMCASKGA